MAKEKKEKPPKKEKKPKKEKAPKEQNEETLLQKLMRQAKIQQPQEEEGAAQAQEDQEGQEEPGKGKRKLLLLIAAGVLALAAVAVVVIFVVLPRLGNQEPDEPPEDTYEPVLYDLPESYEVGEEKVPAVVPVIADRVQAAKAVRVSYTYIDMTNAGEEVSNYVSSLKEEKFSVVDEEFVRCDAPDFTTREGTVLLAKNLPKPETPASTETDEDGNPIEPAEPVEEPKDMVLTVELEWSEGTMVVTCDQAEGKVTSPPQPERPVTAGANMSMTEAVDFLRELTPAVLGLEGDSMDSYRIYAKDGTVLVDGQPCMRLSIYSRDNQTNEVAGSYLLSRDGLHLYLLDESAGRVKEIKLP